MYKGMVIGLILSSLMVCILWPCGNVPDHSQVTHSCNNIILQLKTLITKCQRWTFASLLHVATLIHFKLITYVIIKVSGNENRFTVNVSIHYKCDVHHNHVLLCDGQTGSNTGAR